MIDLQVDERGNKVMEILKKAKELGILISESEEMKNLKESELLMNQDKEAAKLIEDHRELQLDFMQKLRAGEGKEVIEEARTKLLDKQKQLNEYNVTRYFLDSKKEFDELIKSVNNIMTHEITGESHSCGESCNACGGCH